MEHFDQLFLRATDETQLLRTRKNDLYTFGATSLPYIFLAHSAINEGDTIVRRGEIQTEKPAILFGGDQQSHFEGFEEEGHEELRVLFMRAFKMPNLNVQNQDMHLDVVSKELEELGDQFMNDLDRENDSRTAVIRGPEDLWGISLLIYAGEMTRRSAPGNMKEIMKREQRGGSGLQF
jgi:hypothetical protein